MNKLSKIFLTIFLSFSLSACLPWNNDGRSREGNGLVEIHENQTNEQKIERENQDLIIGPFANQNEDVQITNGNIEIKDNSVIKGDIILENGDLKIGNSVVIHGEISVNSGNIETGDSNQFLDKIEQFEGNIAAGGTNLFGEVSSTGTIQIQDNNAFLGDIQGTKVEFGSNNSVNGSVYSDDFSEGEDNLISGTNKFVQN